MSYDTVLDIVKTVPESGLDEISGFIDYVVYRYNEKYSNQSKLKEFNLLCEESQSWAKENNITENDIKDSIKSVRAEKNSKWKL